MHSGYVISCVCLASLATAPRLIAADDPLVLDQIKVTASQLQAPLEALPYTAQVLPRGEYVDHMQARTFADALQETPGILIQRTSYGQASPYIRGFTGFRTLLLIDGIRLNNAVFREGPNQYWSTVDLYSAQSIEVIKGPSSVLHGSDAIGGTVNVLTREPDRSGPVRQLGGTALYRYASAENSHTGHADFQVNASKTLSLLGGITFRQFDDLRAGSPTGLQPGSGYSERAVDLKSVYQLLPKTDLRLAYQRVSQIDVPRTHATIEGKSFAGTAVGTDLKRDLDQFRELAYVQVEIHDLSPWLDSGLVSLSRHRQEEEQDRLRSNRKRELSAFKDDQWGLFANFRSSSPFGRLAYGAEHYRDHVDSWGSAIASNGKVTPAPRGPVADDSRYDLFGAYLQDQIPLGLGFDATLGVRHSEARVRANKVDPDLSDTLVFSPLRAHYKSDTGSVRLSRALGGRWHCFGGVSQGFRAPNLSDLTSFDLSGSGDRETPSPGLRPENYLSGELGLRFDDAVAKRSAFVSVYQTRIEDQITRFPTGRMIGSEREVTRANTGDGNIHGIEAGFSWNLIPGWTLRGNGTWIEGAVDTYVGLSMRRAPVSRIQPLSGQLGLKWQPAKTWWVELLVMRSERQSRLSPNDIADTQRVPPGGTPAYTVATLRGGYALCSRASLSLALENLTDEDYRHHGSGVNETGFNACATLQVKL